MVAGSSPAGPTTAKTFRTKHVAQDWARRTEDEIVRGVYIQRSASEHMTLEAALKRYLGKRPLITACQRSVAVLPVVGQEFMDLAGLLRRQPFQHVFQVGMRLMAVQLGALNQAHDGGGALATAQ